MRAYVTSIGEKTTDICCDQLMKFGYDVVLLKKDQSWPDKYRQFILSTEEDCIRVDADVIVNEKVKLFQNEVLTNKYLMMQGSLFDFYQNGIFVGQPVFYSKKVFPIIRRMLHIMDERRPETFAWRLGDVNPFTHSLEEVMGMHGFFAGPEALQRAKENKVNRGQIKKYDFELAEKLQAL